MKSVLIAITKMSKRRSMATSTHHKLYDNNGNQSVPTHQVTNTGTQQ